MSISFATFIPEKNISMPGDEALIKSNKTLILSVESEMKYAS